MNCNTTHYRANSSSVPGDPTGANAAAARIIVQRAIDDWERVIVDFNYSGGGNTFSVAINAASISGRGVTDTITRTNAVEKKPIAATIKLDDNGGGGGWYFDAVVGSATVPDDGEYTNPTSPFAANSPTGTGNDFYRTAVHELGHAMGIVNTFGGLKIADFLTNAGADPNNGAETLRTLNFNGGAVDYTLTTDGGGHLFEGGGSYSGPTHPNDLMNDGRTVATGLNRRQLISDTNATLLRDVYGYTVTLPSQINTFYVNLNTSTNDVTVNGDIDDDGTDTDLIDLEVSGTNAVFEVNGTTETIADAQMDSIVVNMGNDVDDCDINGLLAACPTTVNGGAGDDRFDVAVLGQDIDTNLASNVTINGGTGTSDDVFFFDANDGANSDTYELTAGALIKSPAGSNRRIDFATLEGVTLNGSDQASTYNVNGVASALTTFNVTGGIAADTFNVGGGDVDSNLDSNITVNGGGGADQLVMNDTTDTAGSDTWTFAVGSISKGARAVNYNTFEGLVVNGNAQATTYNLDAHGFAVPVTINGGAGNETFFVGNGDLDTNISSNATLSGGGGTDSITFEDSTDGSGSNIYTLTATSLAKPARTFNYSGFESLVVTGSALAATYNINGSSSATTIVNGGAGADTVNVGGGDVDSNLGANITVNGGGGADALTFDDSLDGVNANNATFTAGQIVKGSQTFVYSSFATLVWNGAALATTYNVNGVVLGTPVTINGGAANDIINVGGGDYDSLINGEVRVVGNGGVDRVVINDTADAEVTVDTYEVNGGSFTKSSASGIDVSFGSLALGGAPTIEEFVLNASNLNSTINVNSTGSQSLVIFPNPPTLFPVLTTINGSDGADNIVLATAGSLNAIRGNISINGGAGADVLTLNDSADTDNDPFTMTHNTLTNTDWDYTATFSTASETVNLNAGSGNNIINYDATAAAPGRVVLNGNGGVDSFELIEGTATVNGGAGLDNVDVNQSQAGTAAAVFESNQDLGALALFIGGTATVPANGNIIIDANSTGTLRGTLNLNNNSLISRTTSQSFLVDKLARGYNGGAWNGVPAGGSAGVIVSGTAAATTSSDALGYAQIGAAAGQLNIAIFRGVNVAAGNMIVNYTLMGDTDLDRTVDFDDLVSLAQNYSFSGTTWAQGNSNYDNVTDFDDLVPLAQNYNLSALQSASISSGATDWPLTRTERTKVGLRGKVGIDVLERAWDERRSAARVPTTGSPQKRTLMEA